MHTKNIHTAGKNITEAKKVLIMVHGRGGNARDMLSLAPHLKVGDFALLAPQADKNTWYPNSFMAPVEQNEPWLSSAIKLLEVLVKSNIDQGIKPENIYFLGFSQGACLTLEFVARNAQKFGGVAAFTGGLIGEKVIAEKYAGDFSQTPIFIGTGNPDAHVPVERIEETTAILKKMNANMSLKIYANKPHSISEDEIDQVNKLIFNS